MDAVQKALLILSSFIQRPEWGVSELSRHLKLYKSRVHRMLRVVEQSGYLKRNPENGRYRLGLKALELGIAAERDFDLKVEARPFLMELSRKISATVILRILDGMEMVVIEEVESPSPLKLVRSVGARDPCYYGASGKLFLALLPPEGAGPILRRVRLKRFTERSITGKRAFREELGRIRERGFALSDEEAVKGLRGIAVPILDREGRVMAVIAMGFPKEELPYDRIPGVVKAAAWTSAQISSRIELAWGVAGIGRVPHEMV